MLNLAHLARVDLNLLVLFHTVLEQGHVGRAAGLLNLTPSAASHGLRRLRELLHDPLFLRTPKGVVPTDRALALREPVLQMLSVAQAALDTGQPFDAATSERRFILGAPDAVLAGAVKPLLDRLNEFAPQVDIGLVHLMPGQPPGAKGESPWSDCLRQLEQRTLDLALLPLPAPPPRFVARTLYDESFVVAMRKGHPFARQPGEAAFCAARHLLVSQSGEAHGFVDDALARRRRRRRIALTVPSFMMALEHLAGSDLLATVPRRLVELQAARFGLTFAELPFARKPDPIQVIATRSALMDAGVGWLMDLVVSVLGRRGKRPP
jgi:DNA-binding transcriptional LysR family regulator